MEKLKKVLNGKEEEEDEQGIVTQVCLDYVVSYTSVWQ